MNSPELDWKEFLAFRQWLYDEAGIQLADVKQALVAGRLRKRVCALSMRSYRQYFDYIRHPKTNEQKLEHQTALDLLTTNETYFLREKSHFDFLQQHVLPAWQQRSLHCWSAASSSGEEAYTLAMLLAGKHSGEWKITGTDLSSKVVSQAQRAVYPLQRANQIPQHWLQAYCLKGVDEYEGTFKMAPDIRSKVTFKQANLQHSQRGIGPFDIIFLRNVMIYFDEPSKKRVLANVLERLKPDGYLIVSHTESLNGLNDRIRLLHPSIYQLITV